MKNSLNFFMGANSSRGFISYFDKMYDPLNGWFAYIIKGGPGTGKSGLMKKVAATLEERGISCLRIYCSSDPDSLDAVIFPDKKVCIMDGTAPHSIDPQYPGAADTILNLGDFWDAQALRNNAEEILAVSLDYKQYHKRAARYTGAAAMLLNDNYKMGMDALDREKAIRFCTRFAAREMPKLQKTGSVQRTFLSGITPQGIKLFTETAAALCPHTVAITDKIGAAGRVIISQLTELAVQRGYHAIECVCPLFGEEKAEHLLLPELKLAIVTENNWLNFGEAAERHINCSRFCNAAELKKHKHRLSFNTRAADELFNEAVSLLKTAKEKHDILEEYYISAMNFDAVNTLADTVANKISA